MVLWKLSQAPFWLCNSFTESWSSVRLDVLLYTGSLICRIKNLNTYCTTAEFPPFWAFHLPGGSVYCFKYLRLSNWNGSKWQIIELDQACSNTGTPRETLPSLTQAASTLMVPIRVKVKPLCVLVGLESSVASMSPNYHYQEKQKRDGATLSIHLTEYWIIICFRWNSLIILPNRKRFENYWISTILVISASGPAKSQSYFVWALVGYLDKSP